MAEVAKREFHARHRPTGFPKKPGIRLVSLYPLRLQIEQFAPGAKVDESLEVVVFHTDIETARKIARTADVTDAATAEPVAHQSYEGQAQTHVPPEVAVQSNMLDGWRN